jgi:hypothetical protein
VQLLAGKLKAHKAPKCRLNLLIPDRLAIWVDLHIRVGKAANTRHSTEILQWSETDSLVSCKFGKNTHVLERTILHHEHDDMLDISKPDTIDRASKRQQ